MTAYSDGTGLWFDQEPCDDFSSRQVDGQGAVNSDISGQNESGQNELGQQEASDSGNRGTTYVCNLNTKKFHYTYCDSVNKMKESNKKFTDESRESLIAQGYDPCKNCNP